MTPSSTIALPISVLSASAFGVSTGFATSLGGSFGSSGFVLLLQYFISITESVAIRISLIWISPKLFCDAFEESIFISIVISAEEPYS
jgi:hypothetical protein